MAGDDATRILSYLAERHRRARTELDDLRQRGLEVIIAACVTELNIPARFGRGAPVDRSALSEADIETRSSTAPAVDARHDREEEALPPEPGAGSWEWLAPDVPDAPEEEIPVLEPEPQTSIEEPKVPQRIHDPFDEPPPPPPPVSPDPAAEDVRGAWNPPKGG